MKDDVLERTTLFSTLTKTERAVVAAHSEVRSFAAGEKVFSEGEPAASLFAVISGEVIVRKENGTDIARFVAGDCIGEVELFTGKLQSASAFASEGTRLLLFPGPGAGLAGFEEAHPSLSARLLHTVLVETAGRIRRVNRLVKENSPLVRELRKQVYRDKPTGLYNRIYITERIRGITGGTGRRCAVLVSKPDNFKRLNDTWGHDAGDRAIRIMGRALRDFIGDDERTARYQGNAMAVLLPGAGTAEALRLAHDVRKFLSGLDLKEATGGRAFPVTASVGITLCPDHGENAEDLLSLSHELSLEGRYRGGNRVMLPEEKERPR